MFTGIVEETGCLRAKRGDAIEVTAKRVREGTRIGDSIAVNGICLTVTKSTEVSLWFDVMPETLRRSALAELAVGDPLNMERALALGDRLGGHIVTGHIDGVGRVERVKREAAALVLTFFAPETILRYIVEKGSVAINGVSLTVVEVTERSFSVSLVNHTQTETTLPLLREGAHVNIETDIIGKYVAKMATPASKQLTADFLIENGF